MNFVGVSKRAVERVELFLSSHGNGSLRINETDPCPLADASLIVLRSDTSETRVRLLFSRCRKTGLIRDVREARAAGVNSVVIFPKTPDNLKTPCGKEAFNPNGLAQRSISLLKDTFPDLEASKRAG